MESTKNHNYPTAMTEDGGGGLVGLQISTTMEDLEPEESGSSPLLGGVIYVSSSCTTAKNSAIATIHAATSSRDSAEEKAKVIRACLRGNSTRGRVRTAKVVDLWKLRQLALSRGGLLSPVLRRLAWPLLMGYSTVDDDYEEDEDDEAASSDDDDNNNSKTVRRHQEALEKDIHKTVWSVTEVRKQSQAAGNENFWHAPLQQQQQQPSVLDDTPGLALSSPCSNCDTTSTDDSSQDGVVVVESTTSVQPAVVGVGPTPEDKACLEQLLVKIVNDKSLNHYPAGLSNVAALLLVNLEMTSSSSSSSLACQLLSQLIHYPLAALSGAVEVKHMLSILTNQLLDVNNHSVVVKTTPMDLASVVVAPTHSIQVASRIMDACVVSHPLFPLYLGVALASSSSSPVDSMPGVEDAIATALEYM